MPTVAATKYQSGAEYLAEAINAATDTWRIILSNTLPVAATDVVQADAAELTTTGGYTVNGNTCAVSSSVHTGGIYKLTLADPADWTGSGGGFSVQYAILWNQTQDKLICWWDYGSSQAIAVGEIFRVDLDAGAGTFTIT